MIRALALASLLVPTLAFAADPPPADPNTQALGQMIIEAAQREASAKAELIAAKAHITSLEAAAKPATPPPERPATIVPVPNAAGPELPKP
jgi:hypothetical protein